MSNNKHMSEIFNCVSFYIFYDKCVTIKSILTKNEFITEHQVLAGLHTHKNSQSGIAWQAFFDGRHVLSLRWLYFNERCQKTVI